MDNGFEKYLKDHQDRFETGDPPAEVWEKLQHALIRHHSQKARIIRIRGTVYGVAATILLGLGIFLLFPKSKSAIIQPVLVQSKGSGQARKAPLQSSDSTGKRNGQASNIPNEPSATETQKKLSRERLAWSSRKTRQMLVYYLRLIGIRRQQIRLLQDMDPTLYKKSQRGIEDLSKSYNHLKNQLPKSINQARILELMIQNLQMQEQILNNQLQLIESLQSPNPDNEKVLKNI